MGRSDLASLARVELTVPRRAASVELTATHARPSVQLAATSAPTCDPVRRAEDPLDGVDSPILRLELEQLLGHERQVVAKRARFRQARQNAPRRRRSP